MAEDEPVEMQTEGAPAESSGEESSGEESSGEEEEGAAGAESAEKVEVEDDRLEGESKAARDKRVYMDKMRAARAERKMTQASSDEALKVNNADIARQQVRHLAAEPPHPSSPLPPPFRPLPPALPLRDRFESRCRPIWPRSAWRSSRGKLTSSASF